MPRPTPKSSQPTVRNVALCYVRQSVTRNADDRTSPERQRANIQTACDRYGWKAEWYEDASGHKSATKEENRPAWIALKTRLKDGDVVAIVVNEQSRAMRNAWRAIKLFEELPAYGVKLHLAGLDRTIDITTPDGRMSAYMQAFLDDLYALDASRRAKDSVQYRHAKGETIGIPPFGTIREKGKLVASSQGAWLMPDGSVASGENSTEPPHESAVWRGYFDCAERILQLYRDGTLGYKRIAQTVMSEGYQFRDRWGQPRSINSDDARRVVANWRAYAGLVGYGRAKEVVAHKQQDAASVLHETGRAVFDLDLLKDIATVHEKRSLTSRPVGTSPKAYIFGLSQLLYCAHCDAVAIREENPKRRARIAGWNQKGKLRYRHSHSQECTGNTNSIFADVIETDFARLVEFLNISDEALDLMTQLAVRAQYPDDAEEDKLQERKRVEIARVQRAMKNVRDMGRAGYMDADEVIRDLRNLEGELQVLQTMTNDHQVVRTNLMTCMEILRRLKLYWADAEGEDKRILAHSLFEEIVYDMDAKQITDFTVKAWAEPFLIYRAELLEDSEAEETKNRLVGGLSNHVLSFDPNGLLQRKSLQARRMFGSICYLLGLLYPSDGTTSIAERNKLVRGRFAAGESLAEIASDYGISPQRISQIVRHR
ncbi:MAG: recombinase family protein [Chloroflexi bacterium]|nr:recombinase family protein [Chloroflexota bacterium]